MSKKWRNDLGGKVWSLLVTGIRVSVHRHLDYPKDAWLLSVTGLVSITNHRLHSTLLEDARYESLRHIELELCTLGDRLSDAILGELHE